MRNFSPSKKAIFSSIGLKALEFEKEKTGIAVGAPERLESVLDTLIIAIRAGELDRFLEATKDGQRQSAPKRKGQHNSKWKYLRGDNINDRPHKPEEINLESS